jgi:hypothetical protein
MFNDKPYETVNREERFYCALFGHALLSSGAVREGFSHLVANRFDLQLDVADLSVFLEAATLRDYWNDLGDPREYSPATHGRRRAVLDELFQIVGLDADLIDRHDFFWTGTKSQPSSKLWSPGRWDIPREKHTDLSFETLKHLRHLKWAFNAKPDMLLLSATAALMLEAKLESGEGVYDNADESRQTTIQKLIATILARLVPSFLGKTIKTCTLGLRGPSDPTPPNTENFDFSWKEIAVCCDTPEMDDFTKRCLLSLERYR